MLNTSTTTKTPGPRKKKLEDAILTKSKRFIKDSPVPETPKQPKKAKRSAPPTPTESLPTPPAFPTSASEEIPDEPRQPKKRKPRHDSEEGKKFLKAKAKARALEYGTSELPALKNIKASKRPADITSPEDDSTTEPPKKKSKKSKKKRKKPKVQGQEVNTSNPKESKRPETEERQRNESLAYLQLWSKHRDHWKFEKLKQMWLLKHAISPTDLDDKFFKILLEYIGSAKGAAKVKTLQEMQEVMAGFEKKYGSSVDNPNSVFNNFKPEKRLEEAGEEERKVYERATQIVHILSDN